MLVVSLWQVVFLKGSSGDAAEDDGPGEVHVGEEIEGQRGCFEDTAGYEYGDEGTCERVSDQAFELRFQSAYQRTPQQLRYPRECECYAPA